MTFEDCSTLPHSIRRLHECERAKKCGERLQEFKGTRVALRN